MSEPAPRILFIPVSGRHGVGEYARAAALARAIGRRWPGARLHFALSRSAPYADSVPFPVTWLESSATFHTPEVIELMRSFRPQVVIFDNAGRTGQLEAARRLGARLIYVSARRRQRAKAFRLRWMRRIDEHWIAYPRLVAGELTLIERAKLRWLGRPIVRYLDVVLSQPAPGRAAALRSDLALGSRPFVLVVPGGGTGHRGAAGAIGQFHRAAEALAAQGIDVVLAGIAAAADADDAGNAGDAGDAVSPSSARLHLIAGLPQADLAALMREAQVVLANGGSTLLQAIACGAACVAAAIAKDQGARIRRCAAAGVACAAPLEAGAMARLARALLDDEPRRLELVRRARALELADGIDVALAALAPYIEPA